MRLVKQPRVTTAQAMVVPLALSVACACLGEDAPAGVSKSQPLAFKPLKIAPEASKSWPVMIDSDNKAPILFSQAAPDTQVPEQDDYTKRPWFLAGPSDAAIKGRLLYIFKLGSTSAQFTFKDFNFAKGSQASSVWSASTSEFTPSTRLSLYELRAASLSPQGDSLDLVITQAYLTVLGEDKLPPPMVPVRWDFNTGRI